MNFTRPSYHRFTTGQFAGIDVEAEIEEIQQAEMGRKYAKVDRRALDPPPVVQLRLYHIHDAGRPSEYREEMDYKSVDNWGLVCHVDLFAAETSTTRAPVSQNNQPSTSTSTSVNSFQHRSTGSGYRLHNHENVAYLIADTPVEPSNINIVDSGASSHANTEAEKHTDSLVGDLFVQAVTIEYQEKPTIVFPFPDLSVQLEGDFVLRYRAFEIYSKSNIAATIPVIAQCHGGRFRVYSTKEFPGLRPSTDLTKALARWGVRLNVRETERKRRKNTGDDSLSFDLAVEGS